VDFELTSAIRTQGDPELDTSYQCPDEEVGCEYNKWVECALHGSATTQVQKMDFLVCWEESSDQSDLPTRAQACVAEANLNWSNVSACQNGEQVARLQKAAAIKFETKWPSHAHSGKYHVPHVIVADKDVGASTYTLLLRALCDAGALAAACADVLALHYMSPPCAPDEVEQVLGRKNNFVVCAKPCADDASCPTDLPSGIWPPGVWAAQAKCALQDASGQKYCVGKCKFGLGCGIGQKCVGGLGGTCAWPTNSSDTVVI